MLIVDAQIHLWNAGNPTHPTHRQVPAYLKDDALREMDAGGNPPPAVDPAQLDPPALGLLRHSSNQVIDPREE